MNLSPQWQVFLVLIHTEAELIGTNNKYDEESFNC